MSNVFEALVLFAAAASARPSQALDVVRGASTVSLLLVGIVFSVLLAHVESDLAAWVNAVLHYAMPVAAIADWALDPPALPLSIRDALLWLLFPLAYVAYALVRGAIVHWYPYPFLNVDVAGPNVVATYVVSLTVLTCLLAALVLSLGNRLRWRRNTGRRTAD